MSGWWRRCGGSNAAPLVQLIGGHGGRLFFAFEDRCGGREQQVPFDFAQGRLSTRFRRLTRLQAARNDKFEVALAQYRESSWLLGGPEACFFSVICGSSGCVVVPGPASVGESNASGLCLLIWFVLEPGCVDLRA
jgi:hypothetical protein